VCACIIVYSHGKTERGPSESRSGPYQYAGAVIPSGLQHRHNVSIQSKQYLQKH